MRQSVTSSLSGSMTRCDITKTSGPRIEHEFAFNRARAMLQDVDLLDSLASFRFRRASDY